MVFKWRDDHTQLVLDLLSNQECLWNVKSENYRNRNIREKALEEMVKQLNIPDLTRGDVKLKIKSIRSRYSCELAKVLISEKSGAGRDHVYVPKLFWFKQADLFLRSVCTPRLSSTTKIKTEKESDLEKEDSVLELETGTNYSEDNAHEMEEEDDNLTVIVVDSVKSDKKVEGLYLEKEQQKKMKQNRGMKRPIANRLQDVNSAIEKEQQKKMKRNRGMKRPIASGLQDVNSAIENLRKIFDDCKTQEDEFDFFGKSLAVQLKKMPLQRALICQQKLQQIMMDERMYQLNEGTRHTSSPLATSSCYSSISSPNSAHSLSL